ncbi:MAG: hypothetical protein IKA22_04545 [Lentisphaeria bacterium]|nr:hypothetical protein [Lentisphaeria bacterium]
MNKKALFLSVFAFGLALLARAESKVIFTDDFQNKDTFAKRWRNVSMPGKSTYTLDGKGLVVSVHHNPFNDGYIECDIPLIKKGMLEFDMEFTDPANTSGIGLFVDIYNISSFFHSSCKDWRYYFPQPESKRIAGFGIEPVGHQKIANVAAKSKSHYRIVFDAYKDRVEFFKDDMNDPSAIVGNISVFGHDFYRGGKIRIGSMGYSSKGRPFSYRVMNLKLTELKDDENSVAKRQGVLIFQGMTFDELQIFEALTANGVKKEVCSRYTMESTSSAMIIANRLIYNKMPGENRLKNAEIIVLADAPAGPKNIIPDFILKDMADFVKNGGRLVVFGGFFTLEKGEYQRTPLAEVLPVELATPYATGKFAKLTKINSRAKEYDWINSAAPFNVRYFHDLKLKKNAVVKMTAGGKPMLVEWQCGKGSVAVFLGKKAGYGKLFTDNPQWLKLAAQICKGN